MYPPVLCPCVRPMLPPPHLPHMAISTVLAGATAAAAGLLLGHLSANPQRGTGNNAQPCEACNGDGYIDCLCRRWSNASSSQASRCTACHGSLRTRCPRCRGGGTAIPAFVPIPVRIRDEVERMFSIFGVGIGVQRVLGSALRRNRRNHGAFVSSVVAVVPRISGSRNGGRDG